MAKRNARRSLKIESLESRDVPSTTVVDVAQVKANAPPKPELLHAPDMPAFDDLSAGIVGAIQRSWELPLDTKTDAWVVQLSDGQLPFELSSIGAVSLTDVSYWPNSYIVKLSSEVNVSEFPATLAAAADAEFFYPLIARTLTKKFVPNDPLFNQQWHLRNTGQSGGTAGADANVVQAWDVLDSGGNPIRGGGVLIGIVDDGLQNLHPDLAANYVAAHSYDFNDDDPNPAPGPLDAHGTAVAGVAAGRGNNNLGVSGAAPEASLAGIRLISTPVTDDVEADALGYHPNDIDIYSNSWGPIDDSTLGFIGPMALAQLEAGATTGRGGLGSIYTWAAGNGLQNDDNVNYDPYANSRFVIAVGAIDHSGVQSYYSEPGAAMLVTAYSNGNVSGIVTTDLMGSNGYNGLIDQNYTDDFGGTSSATPLVSGVIALMLDANPNLTVRDIQQILVRTAEKNRPGDPEWTVNGAGHDVNHKYGFGAIDALAAVNMAKTWINVQPQIEFQSPLLQVNAAIPDNNPTGVSATYIMAEDMKLEHVEVRFNATHTWRGDLQVELTSPSGTKSLLAETHLGDGNPNYHNWLFSTVRSWDETPLGQWRIRVTDGLGQDIGTFLNWQLNFYGTEAIDPPLLAGIEATSIDYVTGQGELPITNRLILTDTDSANMTGATVSIANNYNASQDFLRFDNQNGISGVFAAGTLTLTGTASVANYQAALRSVRYQNTSAGPTVAPRRMDFKVKDTSGIESNIVSRTVNIIALNNAPTLNPISDPPAFNEDGTQTVNLTGITAGVANIQDLTVTAVSDNPTLLPNITVNYTSSSSTGSLNYTPAPNEFGTAVVTVTVKDSGGTANGGIDTITRTFTVNVNSVNDAPAFTKGSDLIVLIDSGSKTFLNWATDISAGAVNEAGQTLNFVVNNDNNSLFSTQPSIDALGNLFFAPAPGQTGLANVSVRLNDDGGTANGGVNQSAIETFTIQVEINDAPVLDTSVVRKLSPIPRNMLNPAGDTIAALVGDTISDPDLAPVEGIAVVGLTETTNGVWEHSLNGGIGWAPIGTVSASAAKLLRAQDMVRFRPNVGFIGTPKMTYHAWDQSSGTAGGAANLTLPGATGGDKAFSIASTTANLRVAMTMTPLVEDQAKNKGDQVLPLTSLLVTDLDPKSKRGMAITGLDSSNFGTWEYSAKGKWTPITAVSPSNALLLADKDKIRFVPNANQSGEAYFNYHAWDQTSGVRGGRMDIAGVGSLGGGTAFSSAEDIIFVQVTPAADQPVLDKGPLAQMTPVVVPNASPPGNTVAQILRGAVTDGDGGDPRGLGVVGVTNTGGRWQYSLASSGGIFNDIVGASTKTALLLGETDLIRFLPDAGVTKASPSFKIKAWDQSSGAIGGTIDTTKNLSFSAVTQTVRVSVTDVAPIVNSAPVLNTLSDPQLSPYQEDAKYPGDLVSSLLLGGIFVDRDGQDLPGVAITSATSVATGVWQYNAGAGWKNMSVVSDNQAVLLKDTDKIRFLPATNANGEAELIFRAWDRTQGSSGQMANLTRPGATGGNSGVSSLFETVKINVQPVNDAPILNVDRTFLMPEVTPNDLDPDGIIVSAILGIGATDVDGDPIGIAVTSLDLSGGAWEYQVDGLPPWKSISSGLPESATLVGANDRLRFFPGPNFVGTQKLTFKAWDQSVGQSGGVVSTLEGTAFSKAIGTLLVPVNSINDRPMLFPKVAAKLTPVKTGDTNPPGTLVGNLTSYSIVDPDAADPKGIAVVAVENSLKKGTWEYSINGGANWVKFTGLSTTSALLLRAQDLVRFTPIAGFVGTAKLTYHAWDQSSGAGGAFSNPLNAASTAFSLAKATSIVQVNTAPNLDA